MLTAKLIMQTDEGDEYIGFLLSQRAARWWNRGGAGPVEWTPEGNAKGEFIAE